MKKFIVVIVVLAMILTGTAFAEPTIDELQEWADNRCTWFEDTQTIKDDIAVMDIDCHNFDDGKDYHFVLVVEGSEADGNWTAQLIVTERGRGWVGNWYAHNVDQFEEDWVDVLTEIYKGTL